MLLPHVPRDPVTGPGSSVFARSCSPASVSTDAARARLCRPVSAAALLVACALATGCSSLPSMPSLPSFKLPSFGGGKAAEKAPEKKKDPDAVAAQAAQAAKTAPAPAFKGAESTVASLPRPSSAWWTEFGSEELNRLQELALANNRDHRVAIARVAQANAQARISQAAKSPTVDITGGVSHSAPEAGRGRVDAGESWNSRALLEAGVRASYEVDLWGRLGYAADSAMALAAASQHARETVALTLTADVATAYFEYLTFAARAETLQKGIASRQRSMQGVKRRAELGDSTSVEIERQAYELARTEEAAAVHARRRELAFNRLAQLLGMSAGDLKLQGADPGTIRLPEINQGLPSELLCRRPDVRRAEAQLESARLDIKAARASLLPTFSLTAEGGIGARVISELASGRAIYYLLSTALTQNILDGGRKSAQLEVSRARQQEVLEQYSGTLLLALRDVEDALANRHYSGLQHSAYLRAVESSDQQFKARRKALDAGNSDLLSFYLSEQRMLEAQDSLQSAYFERMRAAVDLYKAIGGGSRVNGRDPCLQ